MSVGMVTVDNAPRDMQGLLQLKRGVRSRLAAQVGIITNDQQELAFQMASDEESSQALLAALQAIDAGGGAPLQQLSPQPQPMPSQPQMPMTQQQQIQFPQQGAQLQLAPVQPQVMPPLQPPQQMQYPTQMPPQQMQQVQQPQYAQQQMTPQGYPMQMPQVVPPQQQQMMQPQYQQPMQPQMQYQQPLQQMQPQQVQYAPPQYPPQQVPQQPPQAPQQAPMVLPPVQMPQPPQQPQVTPPAQAQQAPVRAPSTRADPTNAGESKGKARSSKAAPADVAHLPTDPAMGATSTPMLQIQQQVAEALQKLAETSAATQRWLEAQQVRQSQLLSAILQLQLYVTEQSGIDPAAIARSIRVAGADTVGNYLRELEGEAEGK